MCRSLFTMVLSLIILIMLSACSAKSKEDLLKAGAQEFQKGNAQGAIVFLKNALEKDQNFTEARYQLAKCYVGSGKYEQAEKEFNNVLRQDPGRKEIKLELARIYGVMKKPDSAIRAAEDYLKVSPGSSEGLEALGVGYALMGRPDEGERYLMQAIKANPSQLSARLALAEFYFIGSKFKQAQSLLEGILKVDGRNQRALHMSAELEYLTGNKEKALGIYQHLMDLNLSDSVAFYKKGIILIDRGDMQGAEKIADDLVKRFPKKFEGTKLKGIACFHQKKYAEAVVALQNSIRLSPSIEGYYFLGLCHFNRGEFENALNQFQRILDFRPSYIKARLMAAMTLMTQKRLDDAIAEAKRAIAQDNKNAFAHHILGSAYMAKGMPDAAISELNRALDINPSLVDAHLKKGAYHLSKGDMREAEADLQSAVQARPEIVPSRLILFGYYFKQEQYAKAFAVMKQGLSGTKRDAIFYNNMAAARFAEHKPEDAMAYLQKGKEADPAYFPSYMSAGRFFTATGNFEKAAEEYARVLQRDPSNLPALLHAAALQELKGNDQGALQFYSRAKETKTPSAFLASARYFLKKKQTNQAISVLDEGIKAVPGTAAFMEMKGRIYLAEKKYQDALQAFDALEKVNYETGISGKIITHMMMNNIPNALEQAHRIIALKPKSAFGYVILASIHEKLGNIQEAIKEIKKGLVIDGKNPQAQVQLGYLSLKARDFNGATKAFNDAILSDPAYVPAHFAMASLLEEIGRKKEAVTKYRDVLSRQERHVPALNNLASLYLDGFGSKAEGLKLAVTAYNEEPGNPSILDTFGYALTKNGRPKDAVKVLKKAASLLPNNSTVQYHLAVACKEAGEKTEALVSLQKALEGKNFPELQKANLLLTELSMKKRGNK